MFIFLAVLLSLTCRRTFSWSAWKITNNQLCEECWEQHLWIHSPMASQIAVAITSPNGFTWWPFVHWTDIPCSYIWQVFIPQSIGSWLLHFISPWLESWPENNSAAITICCDCGLGATLQHLCYTGIWGALTETFAVYITPLHLQSRCTLQHCSPVEGLWADHMVPPC